MVKENSQLFILVFLGMLTAFGPFVTDMYLPTLPAMTGFFQITSSQVQLGLTASMIGLAVGQLLFGPLSDKYGRRIPLIMAMLLFLFSTLGCLYSATIMQFVGWRLVQGIAGAGGIVSPFVGLGNILVSTGIAFLVGSICSFICTRMALRRTFSLAQYYSKK